MLNRAANMHRPTLPILVVDDYPAMSRLISRILLDLGFGKPDQARDGLSALSMLRVQRYRLVISDWAMEPVSGLELLTQVRADPALTDMPFIMLTAAQERDQVLAAKRARVDGYIIKPFTTETVRQRVSEVLSRREGPLAVERVD